MRPKIVILILIVAVGLVALAAVLKIVMQEAPPQQAQAPEPPTEAPAPEAPAIPRMSPNSSNTAAMLEQVRLAELEKQLDQVRQVQADGPENPNSTALLLTQVMSQEPEVRAAALEALVQLNDTNAIPGLEEAVLSVDDPEFKTAISQAIEYLKLPSGLDADLPAREMTAAEMSAQVSSRKRPIRPNPAFLRGEKKGRPMSAAPGAPTAQPAPAGYPAQPEAQPGSPPQ